MASADRLSEELRTFIDSHPEWLIERNRSVSFYARAPEISFRSHGRRTVFSFPFDRGAEEFTVADCRFGEDEVVLDVFDESDGLVEELRIIRRRPHAELLAESKSARIDLAARTAVAFGRLLGRGRVKRMRLGGEGARIAEIVFEDAAAREWVAVADVSRSLSPERLLSTAVILLEKLSTRKRRPVSRIGVIGTRRQCSTVLRLLASMTERWRTRIDLYELKGIPATDGIELQELCPTAPAEPAKPFRLAGSAAESATAAWAKSLHPAVDVIRSAGGESFRFNGLTFARARSVAGREVIWCGIGKRHIVDPDEREPAIVEMVKQLAERRRPDTSDRRHEFYRLAPEAWLESLLRREIRRLDANLVISPVHEQFRAGGGRIDLLALRSDGRLVIIEVKVGQDRDAVYQALDYWTRIEALRRAGVLQGKELFGAHPISDRPAIVYLVAPTLSYPPETELLLSTVADEVELCRFELMENWREGVKVSRRIT